jgi:transposase
VRKGAPGVCWPWLGFKKSSGHGLTSLASLPISASRKAWILTNGPIRDGRSVLHRCDNAACCNPDHLYLGTRVDNMIDRFAKTPPDERCARGRPFMLTDEQLAKLWTMRREGATLKECASTFDVHIATVCRYITAKRKERILKLRTDRVSIAQRRAV